MIVVYILQDDPHTLQLHQCMQLNYTDTYKTYIYIMYTYYNWRLFFVLISPLQILVLNCYWSCIHQARLRTRWIVVLFYVFTSAIAFECNSTIFVRAYRMYTKDHDTVRYLVITMSSSDTQLLKQHKLYIYTYSCT